MRRFYKTAAAVRRDDGTFGIALDGRPLPTPARKPYTLPTEALADAIAAEWAAQDKDIRPSTMPLTTLAATALDRVGERRDAVLDEIIGYARTDLVCYRADNPQALAQRQVEQWQPLIEWAQRRYDVSFAITSGIIAVPQPEETLVRLRAALAPLDDFRLSAMHALAQSLGSTVLALALLHGEIDATEAFRRSALDELFQVEKWGEDAEARKRREAMLADVNASARFLSLLA
jgi:chaperone required for assembly of F1-ATPase